MTPKRLILPLLVVSLLSATGLAGLRSSAVAQDEPVDQRAISVTTSRDYVAEWTRFTISDSECSDEDFCDPSLTVFKNGREIATDELIPDRDEYGDLYAVFHWSCQRTGVFRWRVEVDDRTATGKFTVGTCGKTRPRAVRRGVAARVAAEGWEDEFVSRSRCSALAAVQQGRSSRWRCTATHNNTIRICDATMDLSFTQQRKFGRTVFSSKDKYVKTTCRPF